MPTRRPRPIRVLQFKPMMPSVNNPEDQEARLKMHFGDDVEVVGGGVACPDEFWALVDLLNSHRADVLDAELPSKLAQLTTHQVPPRSFLWIRPLFDTGEKNRNTAYRGRFVGYETVWTVTTTALPLKRTQVRRRRFPKQAPLPLRTRPRGESTKHSGVSVG